MTGEDGNGNGNGGGGAGASNSGGLFGGGGNGSIGAAVLDFTAATETGTLTTYDGGGGVVATQSTSGAVINLSASGAYFIVT
jgi:hypothetical protein